MPSLNLTRSALLGTLALIAITAHAGALDNGQWRPSGCGAKPEAPTLNLKNVDVYNESVDGINAYNKAIRTYVDCLTQEANADLQAITTSANAAQADARATRERIQADIKTANEKFK